jgi:hypothetical protein
MSRHDYAPQDALEVLIRKLNQRDTDLAAQVQEAVDQRKDMEEREPPSGGRKKARMYRITSRELRR